MEGYIMTSTNLPEHTCGLPPVPERDLPADIDPNRAALIRYIDKKWVNGTILKYHFLLNTPAWLADSTQMDAVRNGFSKWKNLGIGLEFQETQDANEAEIRVGFEPGGSWSYVGRDNIQYATDPAERTMNFGWDLTTSYGGDTVLHEIGHVLGFPHEHQNPNAGIVWNEPETYRVFGGPPNNWSRNQTYNNIIRTIPTQDVMGSNWDKDSIMHYNLPAGVIDVPTMYQTQPLNPAPGLSAVDMAEVVKFYPPLTTIIPEIKQFSVERIKIKPGDQLDFLFKPNMSRKYTIQTFGNVDVVMVLFEDVNGQQVQIAADDDSGYSTNARIRMKLLKGKKYTLRVRLYYAQDSGQSAIMLW